MEPKVIKSHSSAPGGRRRLPVVVVVAVILVILCLEVGPIHGRRGRGRGKGRQKKILISFANANEFSMLPANGTQDHRSPTIVRASHFMLGYRLGGKILLICAVQGDPRPKIRWFKDFLEVPLKDSVHIYERMLGENQMWSKIEIDPATLADGGIFTCVAQNAHGNMHRNYKVEPYM